MSFENGAAQQARQQPRVSSWEHRLLDLKLFKLEHGHCLVPQRYKPNPKLGRWVENCRAQYRRILRAGQEGKPIPTKRKRNMTDERILELEELGFVWTVGRGQGKRGSVPTAAAASDQRRAQRQKPTPGWHERAAQMEALQEERGEIEGDEENGNNSSDDEKMGAVAPGWVAEAVAEGSDFDDDEHNNNDNIANKVVSSGDEWSQRVAELKEYKLQHGNCLVPTAYASNPQLGKWTVKQRTRYRRYKQAMDAGDIHWASTIMDEAQIAQLDAVGFAWVVRGVGNDQQANLRWQHRLEELKTYKAEHGDCLVPNKYEPNMKLARWVMNQRSHYRLFVAAKEKGETDPAAGGMSEQRISKLEEVGFVFQTRPSGDEAWTRRLQELKAYKHEHGDCLVPRDWPSNQPLSNWVSNQRLHYRYFMDRRSNSDKSKYTFMTQERVSQLEALEFAWSLTTRRKGKRTQPKRKSPPPTPRANTKQSAKRRKRVTSKSLSPRKNKNSNDKKRKAAKPTVEQPLQVSTTNVHASVQKDDKASTSAGAVQAVVAV